MGGRGSCVAGSSAGGWQKQEQVSLKIVLAVRSGRFLHACVCGAPQVGGVRALGQE
jgi:hypothetical protein